MKVGLVGCSARKRKHPCAAKHLYLGAAFVAGSAFVRRTCDDWRILSARHGLLHPDRIIAPYEQRPGADARWSREVASALRAEFPRCTFTVFAGPGYRDALFGAYILPWGLDRLRIIKCLARARSMSGKGNDVLIVGLAPSRSSGARALIGSRSGAHLEDLLGVQPGELGMIADTANLVPEWPGPAPSGNGDAVPSAAELRAAAAALDVSGYERLILCGSAVASALGAVEEPLEVVEVRGVPALLLPHPSRVSRWWNDPANSRAAKEAVRSFIPGASRVLL